MIICVALCYYYSVTTNRDKRIGALFIINFLFAHIPNTFLSLVLALHIYIPFVDRYNSLIFIFFFNN
uniref:Uncharacterized protein n=1 Tax=Schistosoma curassoni TaxID=6186 RepID=A0A183L256_9TREM